MGFIATGNTLKLTAYLTQKGRELLLNGSEADITGKYFSLGDSDTNYNVEVRNPSGFVPDLTGDNLDCILSIADNIGIKYDIIYSDKPTETPTKKSEVRIKRTDNDKYYNVLDCLINLDSIGRYMLYHSADNTGNVNSAKVNNNLTPIFTNLFKQIDLFNKPSETPQPEDFESIGEFDMELSFDPNIYKSIINTFLLGDDTVNQNGNIVSPLMLTFSSRDGFAGAGVGSLGIVGRELGYLYKPFDSGTYSFYNANDFENIVSYNFYTDENNQLLDKFTDFTLAARINSKNIVTGNIETLIARGDSNLANISTANLSSLNNESKNANQHLKLFKRGLSNNIINGALVTNGSILDDGMGLVQRELLNLKDFIHISPHFTQTLGTNEYRTSKLTFTVYPKGNKNVVPATLNIVFKFNEDVLLDGDNGYSNITSEGDKVFVSYDFTATNGVFKNVAKSTSFVKNNCASGSSGSEVVYTVPKGTYTGSTQLAADNLAIADISTNGQTYANTHGSCQIQTVYYSAAFAGYIQKSDCPSGYYGSTVYVEVPQGQFTSTISQFDANIQASNYANGVANSQGTCIIYSGGIGGGGCLVSGERIIVDEYFNHVAVEDLKAGDLIYTAHEKTKEMGYYKVLYAVPQEIEGMYYVTTVDDKTISCSPTHFFMVNGVKTLVTTLKKDDKLDVSDSLNGRFKTTKISNIIYVPFAKVTIHKLEIDKAHTYITDNLIWHHNRKALDPYNELPQEIIYN